METKLYVARNECGYLAVYNYKPKRQSETWEYQRDRCFPISEWMFPKLRWEDEPMEVTLIKRK